MTPLAFPLLRIVVAVVVVVLVSSAFVVFSQFAINFDSIRIKSTTFLTTTTTNDNINHNNSSTPTSSIQQVYPPLTPPSDWLRPERWEYLRKAANTSARGGGGEPLYLMFVHVPKTGNYCL